MRSFSRDHADRRTDDRRDEGRRDVPYQQHAVAAQYLGLEISSTWCAISIPVPGSGLPVGLMLVARNGHDRRLFEIAAGIERHFGAS